MITKIIKAPVPGRPGPAGCHSLPPEGGASLAGYQNCTKCGLCRTRRSVVLGRGVIPARLLIIGEAPGKSEDLIGQPFVGPSGRLLESGMTSAAELMRYYPSVYITNVVCCRPCDSFPGPNREPTEKEALSCWLRIKETIRIVSPYAIVLLGDIARKYVQDGHAAVTVKIQHPAFVLRRGGTSSAVYRTFVRGLAQVFEEIRDHESPA